MPRPAYETEPVYCITSDVDWASEDAIAFQQAILDRYAVTPTYFVTHESPLINAWGREARIQVGVHPNFLAGSSHGDTIEEVVATVMKFAPGARCFRGHRFFDATPATHALFERGIRYDSNLCTNLQQGIGPIAHESGLVRFPCFWEDGTHFEWNRGWDFAPWIDAFSRPGIKIFNVHPMITAMNVNRRETWPRLKERYPPARWIRMTAQDLRENTCEGPGPAGFLEALLEYLRGSRATVLSMEELYQEFGK